MSHYSTVQTEFTDLALLVKALNAVGFDTVEVHDEPTGLYGYQGDLRSQRDPMANLRRSSRIMTKQS